MSKRDALLVFGNDFGFGYRCFGDFPEFRKLEFYVLKIGFGESPKAKIGRILDGEGLFVRVKELAEVLFARFSLDVRFIFRNRNRNQFQFHLLFRLAKRLPVVFRGSRTNAGEEHVAHVARCQRGTNFVEHLFHGNLMLAGDVPLNRIKLLGPQHPVGEVTHVLDNRFIRDDHVQFFSFFGQQKIVD